MESIAAVAERHLDSSFPERIQRDWELGQAYRAAIALENRLEMAGLHDLAADTRRIRKEIQQAFHHILQDEAAVELHTADELDARITGCKAVIGNLNVVPAGSPCQPNSASHSAHAGASS